MKENELIIMIRLYSEEGLLIKDEEPVSLKISRTLTREEEKEGWNQIKRELLPVYKKFIKIAQR